jgi:hypothetical protein
MDQNAAEKFNHYTGVKIKIMKHPDATALLKQQITEKAAAQAAEGALLKEQFLLAYESLKPGHIIRDAVLDVVSAPGLKSALLDQVVSLVTEFVVKKVSAFLKKLSSETADSEKA